MSKFRAGYHTLNEINSQPRVWEKSLAHLAHDVQLPALGDFEQVVFIGCGSTHYLSIWAARACQAHTGMPSFGLPSSELLLNASHWIDTNKKTLLVAVSRSAETTETIRAVKQFKAAKPDAVSVCITCYPERELARVCDSVLAVPDATEESIAQTRSFSNMMLAAATLISGGVPENTAALLSAAGQKLIADYTAVAEALGSNTDINRFFFLGSGERYGLAAETMLKMKEISLSYSEAYHFPELRHGPMSMVNDHSLIVAMLGEDRGGYEVAVLRDMKAMGAHILALTNRPTVELAAPADWIIPFNTPLPDLWQAPLYLPIPQLLAYHVGMTKGLNPDRPANLTTVIVLDDEG